MSMYKAALRFFTPMLLFVLTVLWLSSYTHYTSVGIDHDFERENQTLRVFPRIRWTEHGSIWIGYGSQWKKTDSIVVPEKFDLAAVFFRRGGEPLHNASFWNRLGFWFIHAVEPRPTLWIGIPSWLPVLILGGGLLLRRRIIFRIT